MGDAQTARATLVFPAVNEAAEAYVTAARARGEETICAASVTDGEISGVRDDLHRLPPIYDEQFSETFLALAAAQSVGRLFCPVASVHDFMARFIDSQNLAIQLIGQSPIRQQVEQHRRLMARARRLLPLVEQCAGPVPCLSLLDVAGVLRQASQIYGESNDDKLAAMMGIMASAPPGDVIEIGALMGRSAFVLLYLAWRYRVGPVLTVDPWRADNAVQRRSPQALQTLVDEWDFEVMREGFFVNMVPLRADDHSHLRLPSEEAFAVYAQDSARTYSASSKVAYSGQIAAIHIDGNHDHDLVGKDCRLWLGRMLPGSWLILDDYIWAHGDGPYRVGNDLLREQGKRIARAFVCGKALFVQWQHEPR